MKGETTLQNVKEAEQASSLLFWFVCFKCLDIWRVNAPVFISLFAHYLTEDMLIIIAASSCQSKTVFSFISSDSSTKYQPAEAVVNSSAIQSKAN